KDYIAHLASIDIFVGNWFEHTADGRPWRPNNSEDGSPFSIDTWNEARIVERHDASVDDLLTEAADLRAKLWATVDRFTPAVLDAQFNFRGRDITFLNYLQLWTAHDPAHSADMLRAIPERKDEPVAAWLAKYGMG
ncbi:MAG: DinB family protein, partial [Tepidiformaceae bacterium]